MNEIAIDFAQLEVALLHLWVECHLVIHPRAAGVIPTVHVEGHVSTHGDTVVADSTVLVRMRFLEISLTVCVDQVCHWIDEMLSVVMTMFGALNQSIPSTSHITDVRNALCWRPVECCLPMETLATGLISGVGWPVITIGIGNFVW